MDKWNSTIARSFQVVKPSKNRQKGVDPEVKELLKKEAWIRKNITENIERGKSIADIQKQISAKIAENLTAETEARVRELIESKNLQKEVPILLIQRSACLCVCLYVRPDHIFF